MWQLALCAVLARGAAAGAVFPWAPPDPTLAIPAVDNWSPAPTQAPRFGAVELFRRTAAQESGLCGFFDGVSTSSLTCRQSNDACATNTYYGVHGCCNRYDIASCTIPTTCFPQSLMATSCSDASCSSNNFIAKCTASANPECYEFHFVYSTGRRTTTMTEFGCTDTALTTAVPLTYDGYSAPGSGSTSSSTSSSTTTSSSTMQTETPPPLPATQPSSKPNNTPAIIGGVLGGLVIVGALIFAIIYLLLRERRRKREAQAQSLPQTQQHQDWFAPNSAISPGPAPGMAEFSPDGFVGCNDYGEDVRSGALEEGGVRNWKGWGRGEKDRDRKGQDRVTSCGPGVGVGGLYGAVETEGRMVHEAP